MDNSSRDCLPLLRERSLPPPLSPGAHRLLLVGRSLLSPSLYPPHPAAKRLRCPSAPPPLVPSLEPRTHRLPAPKTLLHTPIRESGRQVTEIKKAFQQHPTCSNTRTHAFRVHPLGVNTYTPTSRPREFLPTTPVHQTRDGRSTGDAPPHPGGQRPHRQPSQADTGQTHSVSLAPTHPLQARPFPCQEREGEGGGDPRVRPCLLLLPKLPTTGSNTQALLQFQVRSPWAQKAGLPTMCCDSLLGLRFLPTRSGWGLS
mmetsp:Transcript_43717/g.86247  ORF Transcript_43717/g.86247 Transcript_43717/m.86247 type:complete len:257 (-) Transcript_43717:96-866(-)